ncbi:iron-containing alcohol dehydrogenase [Streptomyces brasiliensis]|uniref:Fe-containing alcohol dehydrogenase-like C-terminal domain-containing protein n=1 Tax=Streptomyces brasiliensis TaxID=1954 RepID=A0A917P0P2_9ACTN|nr:iron-containing alcohol dehydrogenase [Streptomyces brasiliensis]GGJ49155.1 hypothetical protein GCM10010121_070390 [Streptomyces brasiliensis]
MHDVDLTLTLPAATSVVSGINGMAHAVEALYAQDRDPVAFLMAGEALDSLVRSLPIVARRPDDAEARADALYGAWPAGTCLGTVGMALHHEVCHVLGGTFGLSHVGTPRGRPAARGRPQRTRGPRSNGAHRAGAAG